MIYYLPSVLIILLTFLIPLLAAYLCFKNQNKLICFGLIAGATASFVSLQGFKFFMDTKSCLLLAAILNTLSSIFALLKRKDSDSPKKLYLYGIIALTNIFLGSVLFSDLINLNFFDLNDDEVGVVLGTFLSLITLVLFYRKHSMRTSSDT